jgi:hypothetical protein
MVVRSSSPLALLLLMSVAIGAVVPVTAITVVSVVAQGVKKVLKERREE